MVKDSNIWASTAPEYKKQGKLYSNVEYDDEGNPQTIRVAQQQIRRGTFRMEGTTAVHDPHNLPSIREAGEKEKEYVENLPFVQAVDMEVEE